MKINFIFSRIFAVALILCFGCNGSDSNHSSLSSETLENVAHVLWMPEYQPDDIPDDISRHLDTFKNSPAAFGERMTTRLDDLILNPDTWSPDFSNRYNAFLKYSSDMSPHEAYAATTLLGLGSSRGYKEVPSEISFSFPKDDSPQNEYQVGWHFFVGSAFADSGEEFGVQMMFWHYSVLPLDMAQSAGLSNMENQILEMHLAISKAGDRHYRAKPYIVAGTTGLINFSEAPFNYEQGEIVFFQPAVTVCFLLTCKPGDWTNQGRNLWKLKSV